MSDVSTIPSLLATLIERLQGTETLELEFKLAQGGLPKSLWPTVSAFANTCGGWIVLGIGQDESGFKIQGLNNSSQLLDDFYNCLRNPQKINHPVCGARDAHVEVLGNIEVIVIRIPETSRQNRPVYINSNPYQGTYVRRHTGDHHCTKPEVDRMMREASDVGADSAILPDYDLEDIDLGALTRYRRMDQTLHPAEPRITYDDQRYLTAIGGYNRHRETRQEGLTVAGLLLLGTDKALREWRSRHLIDYRLVLDERDVETRWNDRLAWEGHLFGAFEKLYPRLTEGLATGFQLSGATRLDEGTVQTVIREALVNLLVHADYADREASLIIRTPSSFLFRNPGSSRISEFDLLHGDRSDPRNPELVRMFRLIGLAEEAGTGIPKIIRAWRSLGMEMPIIDTGTERYEFTLHLRQAHLLSFDDRRWLRNLGEKWTEAEQLALVHARHNGSIENATLSRLTGSHPADISKVLTGLRDRDFLKMVNSGRYARYELNEQLSTVRLETKTERVRQEPQHTEPNITPEVWQQLLQMGSEIRENRGVSNAKLKDIIVQLCSITPISRTELNVILGRSKSYLNRLIHSLLSAGQLSALYPDSTAHPRQRYVAKLPEQNVIQDKGSSGISEPLFEGISQSNDS